MTRTTELSQVWVIDDQPADEDGIVVHHDPLHRDADVGRIVRQYEFVDERIFEGRTSADGEIAPGGERDPRCEQRGMHPEAGRSVARANVSLPQQIQAFRAAELLWP
ncbi:hypothetical protein [Cellulomonas cellasea]|uniref:Uncharacterized protein n=1 Tax=Cellulomonas cellasea TaxID=43670 RepID=A0A7W4UC63_9CELL|nr:hypothetical protein [Cellulomonas cellasea]MBB2921510.1 hypothetical protein [Cellulomonas cellasea]